MSNSSSPTLRSRFGTGFVAAFGLAFSSAACASVQDIESADNQVIAQIQRVSVRYNEMANDAAGNPFPLDSERGHFTTSALSASAMRDVWLGRDYFDVRYNYFSWRTAYTGGTLSNPAYGSMLAESGAKIADAAVRYGKGFVMGRDAMVTPYGELGTHRYVRTLGLGTPTSYEETYTHHYYGLGMLVQYSPLDDTVLTFNVMVGRTYHPRISIVFPAPYSGFATTLGDGTVKRVGFAVDYALTRHLHAIAGADLMAWGYGASASLPIAPGVYIYEPDSRTYVTAARAGLGLAF